MATVAAELRYIRRFQDIGIDDIPTVGGKNASLGEMHRELRSQGVNLADGFAVTADAYWRFLRESGLDRRIAELLSSFKAGPDPAFLSD